MWSGKAICFCGVKESNFFQSEKTVITKLASSKGAFRLRAAI